MAISSPFRKSSHSRENSREETPPSSARSGQRAPQQLQGTPYGRMPQSTSGARSGSAQKAPSTSSRSQSGQLKKSNTMTSTASAASSASASLAQQYESDKQRLIKYCFSTQGPDGVIQDSYITHVRVIEDAAYPSTRPPPDSPPSNKKPRILALAVKKDGSVHLHKGRENANGSFQIGRTWSLNDLTMIKKETTESGFICSLGKDYYWETNTARERQVFITSFVRVYRKFKNGLVPQLPGWDLSIFGLDENSYRLSVNPEITKRKGSVASQQSPAKTTRSTPQVAPVVTRSPQKLQVPPSPKKVETKAAPTAVPAPRRPSVPLPQPVSSSTPPKSTQTVDPYLSKSSAPTPKIDSHVARKNSAASIPIDDSSVRKPSVSSIPSVDPYARKQSSSSTRSRPVVTQPQPNVVVDEYPLEPTPPLSRPATKSSQRSIPSSKDTEPHSVITEDFPTNLKDEINEQMRKLGLDDSIGELGDDSKLRDAQNALDIPARFDGTGVLNHLERTTTTASATQSVVDTIRSVEIVSHRRSMIDAEEDSSEEDDITALYHDSSDQLESSVLQEAKEVAPTPFPTENDSQDFSFENSYGENEASVELVNATPRVAKIVTETPTTVKANVHSEPEDDYDDLNDTPVTGTLDIPKAGRTRRRANTIESALEAQETDRSSFDDIFDEINWDSDDDAETLTMKLVKELADTEYDTTKKLIEIRGASTQYSANTAKITEECNKLKPTLDLLIVELSGVAPDIQHIESQNKGLQVESINKKNLWSELSNLLNTVAVDDSSLRVLLSADIDRDLEHVESVLTELESAINAIRGDDKGNEDLGDMRALRERRASYESVISQFIQKMSHDLDLRFNNVMQSVNGNADIRYLSQALSELLTYAGITLFIKQTSEESFYDLVGSWESHIAPFYNNTIENLNLNLKNQTEKEVKFTLSNPSAFETKAAVIAPQKLSSHEARQNRLKEKFGLSEPSTPDSDTSLSSSSQASGNDAYFTSFQTILNHVILQQDFLVKFFHMSSADSDLSSYVLKHPLRSRQSLLSSSVGEIDFDRTNARDISATIGAVFQPALDHLQKTVVHALRNNQKNTPGILLWIELFEKKFESTNQEYLMGQFKKMSDRLSADWAKFVDMENKTIEKTTLAQRNSRGVSIIVKNFCKLVAETEKTFAKTLAEYPVGGVISSNLSTGREVDAAYVSLAKSILANLSEEFEEKFSRFKLHEGSESKDKRNYLINLAQNSNWVIDSLSPLKLPSLAPILAEYQTIYNNARDEYVKIIIDKNFGKVANFVHDVTGLLNETAPKSVDPSKRNAYNKNAVAKLLSGYSTREVSRIINDMRHEVVHHYQEGDDSELQRQLVDKIWSALQAEFVSITMELENIMDSYYRDVEQRFTKKDVIASFNASRISQ